MAVQGIEEAPTLDGLEEIEDIIRSAEGQLSEVGINRLQSQYLVEKFRRVRETAWIWRHYMLGLVFQDESSGERFRKHFEQRTAAPLRELCWVLQDGLDVLCSCSGDWLQRAMKRADCRDVFQAIMRDLRWCMEVVHEEIMQVLETAGLYSVKFDVYTWDDVLEESLGRFWQEAEADVSLLLNRMDKLLEDVDARHNAKLMQDCAPGHADDANPAVSLKEHEDILIASHLTRRLRDFDRPLRQDSHNRSSSADVASSSGDTVSMSGNGDGVGVMSPKDGSSHRSGVMRASTLPDYFRVDASELTKIKRHIGLGASGAVYEITWLRELYAVKSFSSTDYKTFTNEAAILANLKHPNIVQLICCSKSATGECALVMDVMQKNLSELIRSCVRRRDDGSVKLPPFSLHVAVDIMLQIARSMEYLHGKAVMHRDLKSLNILVEAAFVTKTERHRRVRVKTADFGFSKIKTDSSTFSSINVGTSYWRAPEVFRVLGSTEEHPKYKRSADVYSFAITCYEILTGDVPFRNLREGDLYQTISRGERPELPTTIPFYLASCLQRWWAADPGSRPSFTEIRKTLEHLKSVVVRVPSELVEAILGSELEADKLSLFSTFTVKDVEGLISLMGQEWCANNAVGPNAVHQEMFLTALQKVNKAG